MVKKLIIFLIRRKLGLRKYEGFQFTNQGTNCIYYFSDDTLLRENPNGYIRECHAGLNFLLSDECKIRKVCRFQRVMGEIVEEMKCDCGDWQSKPGNPELRERIMEAVNDKG